MTSHRYLMTTTAKTVVTIELVLNALIRTLYMIVFVIAVVIFEITPLKCDIYIYRWGVFRFLIIITVYIFFLCFDVLCGFRLAIDNQFDWMGFEWKKNWKHIHAISKYIVTKKSHIYVELIRDTLYRDCERDYNKIKSILNVCTHSK